MKYTESELNMLWHLSLNETQMIVKAWAIPPPTINKHLDFVMRLTDKLSEMLFHNKELELNIEELLLLEQLRDNEHSKVINTWKYRPELVNNYLSELEELGGKLREAMKSYEN
jgi:hypothetical protein